MVRQWKLGAGIWDGRAAMVHGGPTLVAWAALLSLVLIAAVMFSCAGGGSHDRASSHTEAYGGGAACGSTCGG
ncbi:hypothetical protein CASFOL_020600 [Castilleja foliolosa]|uniref:Uncharacterized protein n=1 Tax=Castilleja foliolosa TaxID=1961234 RepID=A0ABD3D1A6_9LAMI